MQGCPATGCFGFLPCPEANCQYCHKETGRCQECKPGYKGQQCELGMIYVKLDCLSPSFTSDFKKEQLLIAE